VNRFGIEIQLFEPGRGEAGDDDVGPSNQIRDARIRGGIVKGELERLLGAVEDMEVRVPRLGEPPRGSTLIAWTPFSARSIAA